MTSKENRPAANGAESSYQLDASQSSRYCRHLHLRRTASRRLPVLDSGRADPWHYPPPGEHGYPEAVAHLLAHGLLPAPNHAGLRAMWRAGGQSRHTAELIAQAWELAA
jgi:hypothetical protein